ncbi:MAG: MFS transporter [Armatimonadota bacterium]|nr:MFS transporter [Armatimonadota bacterium]
MSTKASSSSSYVASARSELFAASCIALVVSAIAFGIRGDTLGDFMKQFNATPDAIGWAIVGAFWGFTIAIALSGIVCDWLGMKTLLVFAWILHMAGISGTVFANSIQMLAIGTLLIGFGNGFIEGAVNPLVATLYPEDKTAKLNALHAWWPGGIVIGTVIAYIMSLFNASWQIKTGVLFIPTLLYGAMFIKLKLPPTERVQSGVSTARMWRSIFSLYLVFWVCMWLSAATELGTNQWIAEMMKNSGIKVGTLVLGWISFVMLIGRVFAGPVVHKLSPIGVLLLSSIVSFIGLIALSMAKGPVMAFLAATVFSAGICYFWPTMLGYTSERFPEGGALLMGLMGAAGMASAGFAQPIFGGWYEKFGVVGALRHAAILPAILTVVMAVFYVIHKLEGGYRAVKLTPAESAASTQAEAEVTPEVTTKLEES